MRIMLFAEKMDDALGQPSRMNSFLGASQRAMEGGGYKSAASISSD